MNALIHDKRIANGRRSNDHSGVLKLVPAKSTPNAKAIAAARELLASLEQGRHTTVVYVAIGELEAIKGYVGVDSKCRNAIKGALLALANEI